MTSIDDFPIEVRLRLAAQRALLGAVCAPLRAVSAEARGRQLIWRAIFERAPDDNESELLTVAGTEVIAEFRDGWTIVEETVVTPGGKPMRHFEFLVFLRAE